MDRCLRRNRLGEYGSINFTVEKSGKHHHNQVIKVNVTSDKTHQRHEPLDMMLQEVGVISVVFLTKIHNLIPIMRKHQIQIEGLSTKQLLSTLQKRHYER